MSSRSVSYQAMLNYYELLGSFELLNQEEEARLFETMNRGIIAKKSLHHKNQDLTKEQITYHQELIGLGMKARDELITKNMKLVMWIAKKYTYAKIPFEDLVQEGSLGLIRATDKFDVSLGYKFSTYATYWIHQSVSRAIQNQKRMVRVPSNTLAVIEKIKRTNNELTMKLGRAPQMEELSKVLNFHQDDIKRNLSYEIKFVSLDTYLDDRSYPLLDIIPSSEMSPHEIYHKEVLEKSLIEIIGRLPWIEQEVIKYRFGLYDGEIHTFESIGKKLHMNQELARQLTKRALRKLRPYFIKQ
jgi:RNA polymerase primary sigma factor